jgi:hypothetical protein
VLGKQQRENINKHKTKKNKFWLKAQIAKNHSKDTQWQSRKQRLLRLSKNHKKKKNYIFCQLSTEKNKAKGKMT